MSEEPKNLWEEWWTHFLRFYDETREIYDKLVEAGVTDLDWPMWVNELRKDWFKGMGG